MERMTRRDASGHVLLDASPGEAAGRLALFEDVCEAIAAEYGALGEELDRLRAAGKEKSYQFREKMGRKLVDAQLLSLLRAKGLLS